MAWISGRRGVLKTLILISRRNEDKDIRVNWHAERELLSVRCDKLDVTVFAEPEKRTLRQLPSRDCRLVPQDTFWVETEDVAPPVSAEQLYTDAMHRLGKKLHEIVLPEKPYLRDIEDSLKIAFSRKLRKGALRNARDWTFERLDVHENGIRLVSKAERHQIISVFKVFKREKMAEKYKKENLANPVDIFRY